MNFIASCRCTRRGWERERRGRRGDGFASSLPSNLAKSPIIQRLFYCLPVASIDLNLFAAGCILSSELNEDVYPEIIKLGKSDGWISAKQNENVKRTLNWLLTLQIHSFLISCHRGFAIEIFEFDSGCI